MAIQGSEVLCRADPPQRWAWARSKSACAEDLQQEIVAQLAHIEQDLQRLLEGHRRRIRTINGMLYQVSLPRYAMMPPPPMPKAAARPPAGGRDWFSPRERSRTPRRTGRRAIVWDSACSACSRCSTKL